MSATYPTPSAAIAALALPLAEEREELKNFIWDFYKYAHGIRPRWMHLWGEGEETWTLERLRAEADSGGEDYKRACEREEEEKRAREVARAERARERVRACNARALAARRFNRGFNALGSAWPA